MKTKAVISAFVFKYVKIRFSHDKAHKFVYVSGSTVHCYQQDEV